MIFKQRVNAVTFMLVCFFWKCKEKHSSVTNWNFITTATREWIAGNNFSSTMIQSQCWLPSCCSKPVYLFFFGWTQKKVFRRMFQLLFLYSERQRGQKQHRKLTFTVYDFFFFFLRLTMTLGWINNIWIWAMFQIKTCFKHKNFNTRQFRWKNYLLYLYSMEEHVWTCKVESPVHIPQLSLG